MGGLEKKVDSASPDYEAFHYIEVPPWNFRRSTYELPNYIRRHFVDEANYLFWDLSEHTLEVVLVPAPRPTHYGHMIRVATNHPPDWWGEIHKKVRNFRRDSTFGALDRIRRGFDYGCGKKGVSYISRENLPHGPHPFKYDSRMRALILNRLTCGSIRNNEEIPPIGLVTEFMDTKAKETRRVRIPYVPF